MSGRIVRVVVAVLVIAASVRYQQIHAGAAPDSPRKAQSEKTGHQEKRQDQSSQDQSSMDARQLAAQVDKARAKAAGNGSYACCIAPGCSWCLLHIGKCTCVMGVGTGKWACRECHGGWEAGQGRIPGKSRADVRKMKTLTGDEQIESQDTEANTPATPPTAPSGRKTIGSGSQTVTVGEKLFQKLNCQSCHKLGTGGGGGGPDLTHEAQRHSEVAWQIRHLQHPAQVHPGSSMPSFASLKPEELKALADYLVAQK